MKYTILLFIVFGQQAIATTPQKIKSTIKDVIVFSQQAQINRSAVLSLEPGKNEIHLTGLSPHVDKNTIQVKGKGGFTILGVSYINNFLEPIEESAETKAIKDKIKALTIQLEKENIKISTLKEQLDFLGSIVDYYSDFENTPKAEDIKGITDYYGSKVVEIKTQLLDLTISYSALTKDKESLQKQLREYTLPNKTNTGVIVLTISSKSNTIGNIDVSYLVNQVQWNPSYDARFSNIESNVNLRLQANLKQTTGVNWDDVTLKFSSAKPTINATIPTFRSNTLDFLSQQVYNKEASLKKSSGVYVEAALEETVTVRGYSSIDGNAEPLYVLNGVAITGEQFQMIDPSNIKEVKVLKDEKANALYGSKGSNGVIVITTNDADFTTSKMNDKGTHFEYEIEIPYTVKSEESFTQIELQQEEIPTKYMYKSLPKEQENAFLVATIENWEQYNLISGKTKLYIDDTFIGESVIDIQNINNTLSFSLGIDQGILIERSKDLQYNAKRISGNNTLQESKWKISIRNTKSKAITIQIIDQMPVSMQKNISIKPTELSEANHNELNGKLEWEVTIPPNQNKDIHFSYEVKFPNSEQLNNYDF